MLATRTVEYCLFEALGETCGVVVADRESNEIAFRFRRDWADFAGEEAETLQLIAEDLPEKAHEMGVADFLDWATEHLSNTFRAHEPKNTIAAALDRTAQSLYHRYVKSTVKEYKTHLPLYPIRAAAGGFGKDIDSETEVEWVDVPIGTRKQLRDDEFLVRIEGRSMEPDIPDGSICRFRRYMGGTRKHGIWLVQRFTGAEVTGEVTIKRYGSDREGEKEGTSVTMTPLNPEFKEWGLDSSSGDRFQSIAEFIEVVED